MPKPLRFCFQTLADFNEHPSGVVTARMVAEELTKRGHIVRFVPFPEKYHLSSLVKKRGKVTNAQMRRFFSGLGDRVENLEKIVREGEHVISFHNSPVSVFVPDRPGARIHELPMTAIRGEQQYCGNPISLHLDDASTPERIIGILELPAVLKPFKAGTPFTQWVRETRERLDLVDTGSHVFDITQYLGFVRKTRGYFSVAASRKAGLLTREFAVRIAVELEKAARNPAAIKADPEKTALERSAVLLLRDNPQLRSARYWESLDERSRKNEALALALERAKQSLRRRMSGRPVAEFSGELQKLNARALELTDRERGLEFERMYYAQIRRACERLGTTPEKLWEKHGQSPRFQRVREGGHN